jgi:1,4-alpha-glucan branching enzyme
MIPLGISGTWEVFIPDVGAGLKYKFAIQDRSGRWIDHADPLARRTELPPNTASIVDESDYQWRDNEWLSLRKNYHPWLAPISIYEVHLGII